MVTASEGGPFSVRWTILSLVDLDSLLGLFYVITDRNFWASASQVRLEGFFRLLAQVEGSGLIKLMHILKTNINFECS